jgi:DNA mismatch repair protein MutL
MAADEGTPTIRLLDPSEAMKIAAGEVVERPASVVKELVENSLDAGSGRIRVEVTSDRRQVTRIMVTDDGAGMNRADARLAFLPHATSKIRALSDLEQTLSLGFRGEALASIAAVSQVTLVTRCRAEECSTGTRVLARGGEILEVGEAGAPPGTAVTVEDLFYNTPARQKFLKSLQTELAQVAGPLEALAISHPWVVFQFVQNGRERLATHRGPDLLETVRAIYGDDVAGSLIPISLVHPLAGISGYISVPSSSWKTPSRVLVSINGRPVFSRQILRAIRQGYGTLLPSHTFPVAFLDLRIEPSRVDVNVHPAKRVVRVGKEQEILDVISEAVRECLSGQDLTPAVASGSGARGSPARAGSTPGSGSGVGRGALPAGVTLAREPSSAGARLTDQRLRQTELPTGVAGEESLVPELEVLGQIAGTYILARTPGDDLILVDQHAAHERVLYDQVTGRRDAGRVSQELLVPVILRESPREAALLRDIAPLLGERGFLVEEFGRDTFLVRGIPSVLGRLEDASAIQDLLGDIFSGEVDSPDETGELISRSIACKGAIKAGTACTREQCERLLAQLRLTKSPWTCPHGRPTMVSFSRSALDVLFKRI